MKKVLQIVISLAVLLSMSLCLNATNKFTVQSPYNFSERAYIEWNGFEWEFSVITRGLLNIYLLQPHEVAYVEEMGTDYIFVFLRGQIYVLAVLNRHFEKPSIYFPRKPSYDTDRSGASLF